MMKIPIVFTVDKTFLPPAYIAIKSLIENAFETTVYDILVLYRGKGKRDVMCLEDLVDGSRHSMKIENISGMKMNVPASGVWPDVVCVRLYLPSILKEYDKVVFSDVDVLFLDDLSEVFEMDMTGYEWGGVAAEKNDRDTVIHQYYAESTRTYIYWAGFMVLNLAEMRKNEWVERCDKAIKKYRDRLFMCDLEIYNLIALNVRRLPLRYVYLQALYDSDDICATKEWQWLSKVYTIHEIMEEKKNAVIVHYAGKSSSRVGKPWLRMRPPEYYMVYLEALPSRLKRQNRVRKYVKNAKVALKVLLEKLHIRKIHD